MSDQHAAGPTGPHRLARKPIEHLLGFVRGLVRAVPAAFYDFFADRCPQFAAAIAYRVLFSLFPLTIALVAIFGFVLRDDDVRARVTQELIDLLPVSAEGEADVENAISGLASPFSALGLISLVALLWGASGMMGAIRIGLETALKVERGRPMARAKAVDFVLVLAAGLLVLLAVAITAFANFFSELANDFARAIGVSESVPKTLLLDGFPFVLVLVTVLLLYRFVPARQLHRRAALVGAGFTAIGFWGTTVVLSSVFASFSDYNVIYGSLAGLMTFLFLVYVDAAILLLGAELAHQWSEPPGPPGPPVGEQLKGFLRGLVLHPKPMDDDEP